MVQKVIKLASVLILVVFITSGCTAVEKKNLINKKTVLQQFETANKKRLSRASNGVVLYKDRSTPVPKMPTPFDKYGAVNDEIKVLGIQ